MTLSKKAKRQRNIRKVNELTPEEYELHLSLRRNEVGQGWRLDSEIGFAPEAVASWRDKLGPHRNTKVRPESKIDGQKS